MDWIDKLEPMLQVFWYLAIPVSLIFLLKFVFSLFSIETTEIEDISLSDGLEIESGDFDIFTFHNLLNFLLGFSWCGISLYFSISNKTLLLLICTLCGSFFVFSFFHILKKIKSLNQNNKFEIKQALGKSAEVYLKIPESMTGKGKVILSVNGSTKELDAMTEGNLLITGSIVHVVRIDNNEILIVEQI
jgi:hypothetical protein